MRVYFDKTGHLRHYGCDGLVLANALVKYVNMPVTDEGDESNFGQFEACVELCDNALDTERITSVRCNRCNHSVVIGLHPVLHHMTDEEIREDLASEVQRLASDVKLSVLNSDIFYDAKGFEEDYPEDSYTKEIEKLQRDAAELERKIEALIGTTEGKDE